MKPYIKKNTPLGKAAIRLLAAALPLMIGTARAADATWTGATDATWAGEGNWSATPVPGTGNTATFNSAGNGNTTIDLGTGVTVGNIVIDTAGAAPYTIGSGTIGSQTLTLDLNGGVNLGSTVTANQALNASLSLPTIGFYNSVNNSANTLTLAGSISTATAGSKVLTVDGTGKTVMSGVVAAGSGGIGLNKTNSGTLLLSGTGYFSATNVNAYLPGAAYVPVDLRQGTTIISGTYSNLGEFVIGGVIANGGAGNNVNLTLTGNGALGVSSWFSLGRGNGIGGVSSDLVLSNTSSILAGNFSAGYNANAANFPKGSLTLNDSSTFTVMGNGAVNFAESSGADFTLTLNGSSQFRAYGTGGKSFGQSGKGTVNLNGSSSMILGNAATYIGNTYGTGVVNMASTGTLNVGGELRVGYSGTSGSGRNPNGTLTISSGTVNVGGLSVGRGNNNLNIANGTVTLDSGALTCTNDATVGFAGTNNFGLFTINGGTFNFAPAATKWFTVGYYDYTRGDVVVNGGTFNMLRGSSFKITRGNSALVNTNTITQNGGSVTFYSDGGTNVGGTGAIDLQYSGAAQSIGIYNLNGGTLTVPSIYASATSGSRFFNFNGGTLQAAAASTSFLNLGSGTGTGRVNVRNGGAVIDSNGKNITIPYALDHSDIVDDAATDGGLTKIGNGTLTLSGGTTYTGPTVVRGGTLSLSPATISYGSTALVVSNATLALDVTGGASYLSATTVALQNNAGLTLTYGTITGNPAYAAINASDVLTASGTNIAIRISGTGFLAGGFPVIDYTGGSAPDLAKFTLSLPPGVFGVLSNDTANSTLSVHLTSVVQVLTWFGADSGGSPLTTWDINTSANWNSGAAKYLEYGTYGDIVTFDDTALNTTVDLGTTVLPAVLTMNNSVSYTISGTGSIGGSTAFTKNGSGSLSLLTANTFTGGTVINAGTLSIANDNALGAVSGSVTMGGGTLQLGNMSSARSLTLNANSSISVLGSTSALWSGILSGTGGLTKTDAGVLTLSGANTYTGPTVVSGGTLDVPTGGSINNAATANVGQVTVGNVAYVLGQLTISGGTVNALYGNGNEWSGYLNVGSTASSVGDIQMTGGSLAASRHLVLANASAAYGGMTVSGGALSVGSYFIVGFAGGQGVFSQSGGTVNAGHAFAGSTMLVGSGAGSIGIVNVSGGSFIATNAGICISENGDGPIGVLNISGTGNVVAGNAGVKFGNVATSANGTLNLLGGTLTVNRIWTAAGNSYFNFNGGTLKPSAASTEFMTGLDRATVYSGGAIIDDNGFNVSMSQTLTAPTGDGVSAIAVDAAGSGYVNTPVVTISGDGTNATAVANVMGGAVTGITITSPGYGYTYATASLVGGVDSTGTPATLGTVSLSPNTSGGLTKLGNGTLTMTGSNTYSGATLVNAGTLLITPAVQSSTAVTVANDASFGVSISSTTDGAAIGNLNLGSGGSTLLTVSYGISSVPTVPALTAGALSINGTAKIRLNGTLSVGAYPVLKYTSRSGSFASVIAPRGTTATISNDVANSTYYVVVTAVGGGIVWTGNTGLIPNLWDINVTTNWLTGSQLTTYQETVPPGDAVVFNDSGSATVLLSNTVSPLTVTITNSSVAYNIQGSGHLSGSAAVTKLGSGTATISLANNDYTGATVISNGTLVVNSGSGIGNLSPVTLANVASAALNIGATETIGSLAGGGALGGNVNYTGDLIVGGNNNSTTYGGVVSGSGTFALNGKGNTMTLNGTLTAGGELWIGGVVSNTPTMNVNAGASLSAAGWFVVGREGSTGVLNVNGGNVVHSGWGNITLGTLGTGPKGTINLVSGSISNLTGETWVGEGSSTTENVGIFNQSGGVASMGNFYVGRYGSSSGACHGEAYITGGSLYVGNLEVGYGMNNTRTGNNTLFIGPAATVNASGFMRLGYAGSSTLFGMVTNQGILNIGATALYLGYWDPCNANMVQEAGQINLRNNASISFGNQWNNSGVSTFDHNGGSVTFYSDNGTTVGGTGSLDLNTAGSGTYTYNLNGGTLTVPRIQKAGGSGTATFNFNGGTLKAAGNATNFMENLTAASILSGAVIDSAGYSVTLNQALLDGGLGGGLVKQGLGTLALGGANSYSGNTLVNNGTLLVNGLVSGAVDVKSGATLGGNGTISGVVTVEAGATLAAGASIGTLTLSSTPTLASSATIVAELNRTNGQTSDLIVVSGNPINYAGTLVLKNTGMPLQAGDTFSVFNASSYSGTFTIVSKTPGQSVTWNTSNLAVAGTVSVSSVVAVPFNLTTVYTGSAFNFSWPANELGARLETNAVNVADPASWFTYPGSDSTTSLSVPVDTTKTNVFFRLVFP
jgi:autotransporter-associated beta strand protein